MEQVQYDGLMGIASEINKKSDAILASCKTKENQTAVQSTIPTVSKEEMDAIALKYANKLGVYFDSKHKEQIENQKELLTAVQSVDKSIKALPTQRNIPFEPTGKIISETKKIAFFGFEFLRSSVVIFILSVAIFWSLVMNIKQMDNYKALKIQYNQLTDYIIHTQKDEKIEKEKGRKAK